VNFHTVTGSFDRLTGTVTMVLVVMFVIQATLKIYVYLLTTQEHDDPETRGKQIWKETCGEQASGIELQGEGAWKWQHETEVECSSSSSSSSSSPSSSAWSVQCKAYDQLQTVEGKQK